MKNFRKMLLNGGQIILTHDRIAEKIKMTLYKRITCLLKRSKSKHSQAGLPDLIFSINEEPDILTMESRLEAYLQRQLQEETAIVVETQERERNAIGMELHDNVNQILVSTKLLLSAVDTSATSDQELLTTCLHNLQLAIDENRRISHEMVAPDFKEEKLTKQIESIATSMLRPAGITARIDYSMLDEQLLQPRVKLAIYRIVQEQCTNIIKHANAKNVSIQLTTKDEEFLMNISDDGIGLQPGTKANGIGLQNIKNRLILFQGTSSIQSEPGKGFCLEIEIPLAGEPKVKKVNASFIL